MNWKTELKLNDLEGTEEFELTCKRCRITRVTTQAQLVRNEPALAGSTWMRWRRPCIARSLDVRAA